MLFLSLLSTAHAGCDNATTACNAGVTDWANVCNSTFYSYGAVDAAGQSVDSKFTTGQVCPQLCSTFSADGQGTVKTCAEWQIDEIAYMGYDDAAGGAPEGPESPDYGDDNCGEATNYVSRFSGFTNVDCMTACFSGECETCREKCIAQQTTGGNISFFADYQCFDTLVHGYTEEGYSPDGWASVGTIIPDVASSPDCQYECQIDDSCVRFLYNFQTKQCTLKTQEMVDHALAQILPDAMNSDAVWPPNIPYLPGSTDARWEWCNLNLDYMCNLYLHGTQGYDCALCPDTRCVYKSANHWGGPKYCDVIDNGCDVEAAPGLPAVTPPANEIVTLPEATTNAPTPSEVTTKASTTEALATAPTTSEPTTEAMTTAPTTSEPSTEVTTKASTTEAMTDDKPTTQTTVASSTTGIVTCPDAPCGPSGPGDCPCAIQCNEFSPCDDCPCHVPALDISLGKLPHVFQILIKND